MSKIIDKTVIENGKEISEITVCSGGKYILNGTYLGTLHINNGGEVIINGNLFGSIINRGKCTINGGLFGSYADVNNEDKLSKGSTTLPKVQLAMEP